MPELVNVVTALVEQVAEVPAERLAPASRFESLDNWTSLAALRLLTGIEDELGVRLDLRRYMAVTDIGGLVDLIEEELPA